MTYLIANTCSAVFEISGGQDLEVAIYSVDLIARKAERVAAGMPLGFAACYDEIVKFYDLQGSPAEGFRGSPALLMRHVEQFRDNLYGLYCSQVDFGGDRVQFFSEAYVSCFAMEMSGIFSGMSPVDIRQLEEFLAGGAGSAGTEFSELDTFFRQWSSVNRWHRKAP